MIVDEPMKVIAEKLIYLACDSVHILEFLKDSFRRDYRYKDSVIIGRMENAKLTIKNNGQSEKITMNLKRENYEKLCSLAYSLDVTPSTAAAALIILSMRNYNFMNEYIFKFLNHLEVAQIATIRHVLNIKK